MVKAGKNNVAQWYSETLADGSESAAEVLMRLDCCDVPAPGALPM